MLRAYEWRPEGDPRAVVCLVHGLGEHAGRYAHVAALLSGAGYAVLAFDQRGHGRTPGPRGHWPSLSAGLADIDTLLDEARRRHGRAPRILYGHSMGGGLVLTHMLRRRPDVAGVVATSPSLRPGRPVSRITTAFGTVMCRLWPSFRMANGLDRSGLSRDPEVVRRYAADPLVHDRISVRMGLDLLESGEWALAHASQASLPLLLVHGTADRITSIDATREFAARVARGCTLREWPGLYHETHNETEWRDVMGFTLAWMEERIRGE